MGRSRNQPEPTPKQRARIVCCELTRSWFTVLSQAAVVSYVEHLDDAQAYQSKPQDPANHLGSRRTNSSENNQSRWCNNDSHHKPIAPAVSDSVGGERNTAEAGDNNGQKKQANSRRNYESYDRKRERPDFWRSIPCRILSTEGRDPRSLVRNRCTLSL